MTRCRSRRLPIRLALIIALLATLTTSVALRAPVANAQPSTELQFMCASRIAGVLIWSATPACPRNFVSIDIVNDGPVTACAIPFTGFLRIPFQAGQCHAAERTIVLGDESPDDLCVNSLVSYLRIPTETGCRRHEFGVTAQGRIVAGCEGCYALVNILAEAGEQGYSTSELPITDPFNSPITDVNITLDISHDYSSDLRLFLRAPDGTNILLIDQLCGDSQSIAVVLDDEAATSVDAAGCPLSGSYRPAPDALSAFDGDYASGVWTLVVIDIFMPDVGTLNSWSLDITTSRGPLATQTCRDCPVALSENNVGTGTDISTATVSIVNAGTIADVDVTLDLSGGWVGQFMAITLVSPSGTEVLLYDAECVLFTMADLEIVYDDEAAAPLTDAGCPATGFQSFQPSSAALSSLDGEDPNGVWTLAITTSLDFSAILWDWSLTITTE